MVGKISMSARWDKIQHLTRHESEQGYSPPKSSGMSPAGATEGKLHHVPWIASPLDPKTTEWLNEKHESGNLTLKRRATVAQTEADRVAGGLFRKQHEASPLELFFDLFFVANLAVFTFNHKQTTAKAVGNYIGFFSMMWTFWFQISIFDVRFYVDSILNRFIKLCQFAMFCGFTGLAPIYSVLEQGGTTRAFRGLSLVFMLARLLLVIQYGTVLWYVRGLKKTLLPLALTMLLYFLVAMAFLATNLTATDGATGPTYVKWWYLIVGIEAVAAVIISSIWRILSFKRTHLVERVGLLTLIVMGEGIIGVIKSIAYILDGTTLGPWDATGRVVASVFLIYLIFVLYFTPIAHDQFGSIRQQFWTLAHLPLHIAIVLTVEGSSATLLWATSIGGRINLINSLPSLTTPSNGYATVGDLITKINNTLTSTSKLYDYLKLKDEYNWYADLNRLKNISSPYASSSWNTQAAEVMSDIVNETSVFIFENFKFEIDKKSAYITDADKKLAVYYSGMVTIFTSFYASAGALLLVLGIMYWIGKNNKTWEEYTAIFTRFFFGLGLPFMAMLPYYQPKDTGFMFYQAGWIISIVTFSYLVVVSLDNIVQDIYDRLSHKHVFLGAAGAETLKNRHNSAFGPTENAHMMHEHDAHADHKGNSPKDNVHVEAMSHTDSEPGLDHQNSYHSQYATSPPQPNPQHSEGYYSPPNNGNTTWTNMGRTSGYDRLDTEYRGHDGMSNDVDVERGRALRFEDETRPGMSYEMDRR